MKIILVLVIFIPIIYLALKQNKWYLYLSIALLGILPDTFAIELSEQLPLITGNRMILLVLFLIWLKKKPKGITLPYLVIPYFVINILISLINLRYGAGELNKIFIMVFEQFLLILIIKDLISDKREFYTCIDFLIMGCMVNCVIGIFQTVFSYDIATVFNLVAERTSSGLTDRMGIVRAAGTTNAIIFGCYLAFMSLFILYQYERTSKKIYLAALIIDLLTLVCTMSRSSWLALAAVVLLMIVVRKRYFFSKFWKYIPIVLIGIAAVAAVKPDAFDIIIEVGKSTLNSFGANLELSSEFGLNGSNGAYSRTVQWTAVQYMFENGGFWFGFGYNAFIRNMLHFFYQQFGRWTVAQTMDVGFVAVFGETGMFGFINYLCMLSGIMIYSFRRRGQRKSFNFYKTSVYAVVLYVLLNVASAFVAANAFWLFIALFFAYQKLENNSVECKDAKKV